MGKKKKKTKDIVSDIELGGDSTQSSVAQHSRKHRRVIRKTKVLFRAIDLLFNIPQNSCPYVNKNNRNSIRVENDIVYDETDPDICKLDFYRDKTEKKLPAIIIIHGGGFTAGDKKYRKGRAQFFALHGFAVFSINYGLAPGYTFPEPIKHIVEAANFVYDNADRFNIDVNRIFADGDSAGGYYAAILGAFNCSDKLKNTFGFAPKFKIFGMLLNCGIYDINTVFNTNFPFKIDEGVILSLTGTSVNDFGKYRYADVCSPVSLVNGDFPPSFLIFSDNDMFCGGQGDIMVDKLNECGVYCEYYSAHDALSNHCFSLTWNGEDAAAANELMLSFAVRLASDKIKLT